MKKEEIKKTSDKKVRQITLPDERYYEVKGKKLPSVTWILESYPKGIAFYKWIAEKGWSEAQVIKEAAGGRGSKVHNAIQDLLKGKEIVFEDKYWNDSNKQIESLTLEEWECLLAFQKFWEMYKPSLIAYERVCYSEKYNYAGTSDAIVVLDGKITLLDWKTSSKIWPTYGMQVAAYASAELFKGDYQIQQTGVLRLGTNHKVGFEFKLFDGIETKKNFQNFLAVKNVWAVENGDKQPSLTEIPESIKIKVLKLKKKK